MIKRIRNRLISRRMNTKNYRETESKREKIWRINPFALALFITRWLWFIGIFIFLAFFVKNNWDECVDFSQLSGYNLLFITFVLLLFIPLLAGFKVSALGIGLEATARTESVDNIAERIKGDITSKVALEKGATELTKELEEKEKLISNYENKK